jgi:hypothetical protein
MNSQVKSGFLIHFCFVEQLKMLPSKLRANVLNDAFSRAFGCECEQIRDKTGLLEALSRAIYAEHERISAEYEEKNEKKKKACAERVAKYREKTIYNKKSECNTLQSVTKSCNTCNAIEGKKEGKKECSTHECNALPIERDLLMLKAAQLGIDESWVDNVFIPEMQMLGWEARNARGGMFAVTAANVASVMRGWWKTELKEKQTEKIAEKNSAPRVIENTSTADLLRGE